MSETRSICLSSADHVRPVIAAEGFVIHDVHLNDRLIYETHAHSVAHIYIPVDDTLTESVYGHTIGWSAANVEIRQPGHRHELRLSGRGRALLIAIESWRWESLSAKWAWQLPASIPSALLGGIPRRLLETSARFNSDLAGIMMSGLALELLARCALARVASPRTPAVVVQAVTYVQDHLGDPLTTGRIASQLGVAARSLAERFRAATGETVAEYVLRQRIEHALSLIATTDLHLKEISGMSGFYDQAHMTRQIKRSTGFTPREHRRAAQPVFAAWTAERYDAGAA